MSKEEIKDILEELYQIDSSFKNYEKDLIKLINKLVLNKPETKFDENFKKELRAKLLKRAGELKSKKRDFSWQWITELFTIKKFAYVATGALLVLVIMIPVINSLNLKSVPQIVFESEISKVVDNAFGLLSWQGQTQDGFSESRNEQGIGAGGGGGMASSDVGVIAPYYVNYRYIYTGDDLVTDQEKMEVLKRIKGSSFSQLSSFLNSFNLGLTNLSSFSNTKVDYVTLSQDQDYGYMINLSFIEGTVNIFENWQKWQTLQCRDQKCFEDNRLKIEDVPEDSALINLANNFIQEHNISLDNYGQPEVDKTWLEQYEKEINAFYIPDTIQVLYPLIINNDTVYDQGGNKTGLMVMVNIRENKVSGIYNLTTQNYQSSLYQTETDAKRILEIAERGGNYGYLTDSGNVIEIEIGQPEIKYVKIWNYSNEQTDELLVPAFIFPILNPPTETYYYKKNVIVPLIKELLEDSPGPIPVPLLEESQEQVPVMLLDEPTI